MSNLLFSILTIPILLLNNLLSYAPFSELASSKAKRLIWLCYALLCAFSLTLTYVFSVRAGITIGYAKMLVFLMVPLSAAVHILILRGHLHAHIFSIGLATLFNYLVASLAVYFTFHFYGWDTVESCVCVEILTTIFSALFFFPIRRFIRNTVRPFLSLDNASYWRSVWLIPATMLLSCYFSLPGNRHMLYISQIVSRVCIVVAVFLVCRIIADDYRHFQEKQAMTEQLNQQKVYYSAMVLDIENMRRQRHDIKHYFAAIQYYIDTNDTEGLQKYCSELLDRVESDTPLPYSGNSAADGVLYHYSQQCEANQIRFQYLGSIRSSGIADTDLCVLLGNALDNAFNGCLTISENRFIQITTQSEKQLLSILVQNSFDCVVEEGKGGILSRKRNAREGVGLSSMRVICQSYNGTMSVDWDGTTFRVCMLLPLT